MSHKQPISESARKTVTVLLETKSDRDGAMDDLLPLVYEELRQLASSLMAREAPGQTLQPTSLVHEAYLRLVGDVELRWDSRAHFFAAAARSMRQILIDRAEQKGAEKHDGKMTRAEMDEALLADEPPAHLILALNAALERLEQIDTRKGRIVALRYFAGLNIEEIAKSMQLSYATVKREWRFACAWLYREMTDLDT